MVKKLYNHKMDPYSELEYCELCGGFEGSMTTDCYGESMGDRSDEVYEGYLNFYKERGWVTSLSSMGINKVTNIYYGIKHKRKGYENREYSKIHLEFPKELKGEVEERIKEIRKYERSREA